MGLRKKFNLPKTMTVHFYTTIVESNLSSSITIWWLAGWLIGLIVCH